MQFLNSNPAPGNAPSGQEWQLGDLGPQQNRTIEVNLRIEQAGTFSYCASATTGSGQTIRGCAATTVAGSQLDVAVRGPSAAEVGTDASFTIEVTNRGDAAVSGVVVSDRFDAGLQHAAAASPIEANLGQIGPRETRRIAVTFRVASAGLLCQEVTVTTESGLRGDTRSCLTVRDRAVVAPPPSSPPVIAGPPTNQTAPPSNLAVPPAGPPAAGPPTAVTPTVPVVPKAAPLSGSRLNVHMTGPEQRKLGETALFVITVTNAGDTPLKNVLLSDVAESSLEITAVEGKFDTRGGELQWTIESLDPGQTQTFRVECRCVKEQTRACNRGSGHCRRRNDRGRRGLRRDCGCRGCRSRGARRRSGRR